MKKGITNLAEQSNDKSNLFSCFCDDPAAMLEVISAADHAQDVLNYLVNDIGRKMIESMLRLSAESIAGPKKRGKKKTHPIQWFGNQAGFVTLYDRKLAVTRPRLRHRDGHEVAIPIYRKLQNDRDMKKRVFDLMIKGVSTRNYASIIHKMADTIGVSKSSISRDFIEESAKELNQVNRRCWHDQTFVIVYLDGVVLGNHRIIASIGVDIDGNKHILGIVEGASENSTVVTSLLTDLVSRGLRTDRHYLFVIDGSKALSCGIRNVFGNDAIVQRCRIHKIRNVADHLPERMKDQIRKLMQQSFQMDAEKGMALLKKHASWLENEHPGAANSLLEGLEELFTVNKLNLSASLSASLGSTNVIENLFSVVRRATNRICRWRNGKMVLRWVSSPFIPLEEKFRKIRGYTELPQLYATLNSEKQPKDNENVAETA